MEIRNRSDAEPEIAATLRDVAVGDWWSVCRCNVNETEFGIASYAGRTISG